MQSAVCVLHWPIPEFFEMAEMVIDIPECLWFIFSSQLLGCGTREWCCLCSKIQCYCQFAVIYNDNSSLGINHSPQIISFSGKHSGLILSTVYKYLVYLKILKTNMQGNVCSTLDRMVWVRALAGDIVFCIWARHFTLTAPLSTQVNKLGVTLRWTNIPFRMVGVGVEIFLATSCYRNQR